MSDGLDLHDQLQRGPTRSGRFLTHRDHISGAASAGTRPLPGEGPASGEFRPRRAFRDTVCATARRRVPRRRGRAVGQREETLPARQGEAACGSTTRKCHHPQPTRGKTFRGCAAAQRLALDPGPPGGRPGRLVRRRHGAGGAHRDMVSPPRRPISRRPGVAAPRCTSDAPALAARTTTFRHLPSLEVVADRRRQRERGARPARRTTSSCAGSSPTVRPVGGPRAAGGLDIGSTIPTGRCPSAAEQRPRARQQMVIAGPAAALDDAARSKRCSACSRATASLRDAEPARRRMQAWLGGRRRATA